MVFIFYKNYLINICNCKWVSKGTTMGIPIFRWDEYMTKFISVGYEDGIAKPKRCPVAFSRS